MQRNNWFRIKLSESCLQAHVVHHAANVPERSASALLDGGEGTRRSAGLLTSAKERLQERGAAPGLNVLWGGGDGF